MVMKNNNIFRIVFRVLYHGGPVTGVVEVPATFNPISGYLTVYPYTGQSKRESVRNITVNVMGEDFEVWMDDDLVSIERYETGDLLEAFEIFRSSLSIKKDMRNHNVELVNAYRLEVSVIIRNQDNNDWYEFKTMLVKDDEVIVVYGDKLV
jgi:hypothetical protein